MFNVFQLYISTVLDQHEPVEIVHAICVWCIPAMHQLNMDQLHVSYWYGLKAFLIVAWTWHRYSCSYWANFCHSLENVLYVPMWEFLCFNAGESTMFSCTLLTWLRSETSEVLLSSALTYMFLFVPTVASFIKELWVIPSFFLPFFPSFVSTLIPTFLPSIHPSNHPSIHPSIHLGHSGDIEFVYPFKPIGTNILSLTKTLKGSLFSPPFSLWHSFPSLKLITYVWCFGFRREQEMSKTD